MGIWGIMGLWDLGIMEKKRHKTKNIYIKNVCF
jgi:hypothetical protein